MPSVANYNSEYFHSIQKRVDVIKPKIESTFGSDMDQAAKVVYEGQERHAKGRDSPGPNVYYSLESIRKSHFIYVLYSLFQAQCHLNSLIFVIAKLSSVKSVQKITIPKVIS